MGLESILGVAGGLMGKKSADDAVDAQTAAAQQQIGLQRETRNLIRRDVKPWLKSGKLAQNALAFEFGLGRAPMIGANPLNIRTAQQRIQGGGAVNPNILPGMPGYGQKMPDTRTVYKVGGETFRNQDRAQQYARRNGVQGTRYKGYQASNEYKNALQGAADAVDASAAASGMALSGRTLQALDQAGQKTAMGFRNNYLQGLSSLAGGGMSAATMGATASQNAANNMGNAWGSIGDANAAGSVAGGNIFSDMLEGLTSNWQHQKATA